MNLVFPRWLFSKDFKISIALYCVKIISKYPLHDLLNGVEIMWAVNSKYKLPMTHILCMDQTLLTPSSSLFMISITRFLNLFSRTVAVSKSLWFSSKCLYCLLTRICKEFGLTLAFHKSRELVKLKFEALLLTQLRGCDFYWPFLYKTLALVVSSQWGSHHYKAGGT